TMERLVPRTERERRIAELGAGQRLRRAELMHSRDRAPDAGSAGIGLVDHLDAADAFALQLIRDRKAALTAADDHDVVIDAVACADPVRGLGTEPALRVARQCVEPLGRSSRDGR